MALCSLLWVMLHRLFITESPFTPMYSSPAIFTSFPISHSVNLLGLQTDWCYPPPSLPDGEATSAGENHILPEMMALENRTWLQLLEMVVVFSDFHQSLITFPVPVSFSEGCTFTLHQQHTSGVDAATFAVTIWQILPKSKRNMSIVRFCWHSRETLPYPRTTYVYWQKSAV